MKLARPLLSFLLGILVVLTVAPCPLYAAVVEEREFRYEAERFRLTPQADGTTRVTLRGAAREEAAGQPDLPLMGERVELPVGLRLAEVRVVGLETALAMMATTLAANTTSSGTALGHSSHVSPEKTPGQTSRLGGWSGSVRGGNGSEVG